MNYIITTILILAIATASIAAESLGTYPLGTWPASAEVTCSGDMSTGNNESFESGASAFCTTDWTEYDTDGVVNTYSSTGYNCGTHALAITSSSATAAHNNRVVVDIGTTDSDVYERFYVTLPPLASEQYLRFHGAGNDNAETTAGAYYLQWYNTGSEYQFKIRTGAGQPTDYFVLTPGQKYRVEIHPVVNAASTLKVWDSSGNPVNASDSDTEVIHTAAAINMQYFFFNDSNSTTSAVTYYIDDYTIDVDGTTYIGAQICN